MRVLVCGGRDWSDHRLIHTILDELYHTWATAEGILQKIWPDPPELKDEYGKFVVIHGHHWEGADKIADDWALLKGVTPNRCPANWKKLGKAAGPIRNQEMLDTQHPKLVLAFWNGRSTGTKDMITKALKAGVDTQIFYDRSSRGTHS